MGSDVKKAWGAQGRDDMLWFDPEDVVLVEDESHPLWDERMKLPLDEASVVNVMTIGILEPILVRKNGEDEQGNPIVEVVDGRQRVRWALEANKRLRKSGKEPLRVPAVRKRGDDSDLMGVMISTNEIRRADDSMTRARKVKRYLDLGRSEEDAAIRFGKSSATIKNLLTLLDATGVVQKAIEDGKLSIQAGKRIAVLPKEEQGAALEEVLKVGGGAAAVEKADKIRGPKRGRSRKRSVKTRAQIKEFRELLGASKAEAAAVGAAVLGWVLGDDDAITPYRALVNKAEDVS